MKIHYDLYAYCVPRSACPVPDAEKDKVVGGATSYPLGVQLPVPEGLSEEGIATGIKEFFRLRKEAYEKKFRREFNNCPLPEIKIIREAPDFDALSENIRQGKHDAFAVRVIIHRYLIPERPFFLMKMDITQSDPRYLDSWGGPWMMPETVTSNDWAQAMHNATYMPWW